LGNNTGSPEHLASGFIYGIPDTQDQIPDHFYTDIGFNYARAGGAQVSPSLLRVLFPPLRRIHCLYYTMFDSP
jgi:hypothetical protein